MAGATDYYADLGLTKDATSAEITKAFRKLALTCHPDRGGDQEQFTRINKAHEVLSDAKARARYDNTGRTTALTPEEEFRESFFAGAGGLFGGGETKRNTGGGPRGATEAEKEEARRRESERQEAQRRLDEADRRDAERRARLNGGGAAAAPPPQAPAAAAAPPPSAGAALSVGMRVKLHSLSSRPELNGLTGVLVAQVQDKWQVRLDGDGGEKLLKAKNLAPNMVAPSPAPTPKPANSTMPAAQPSHSPASQGYPNGAAAPSSTANRGEQLCAHPKCNHLVHSDPKLSKTHCCKVCQGTQTHMAPTHGPACERRVAPRSSVRAEPPAAGARPAAKPQPPTGLPSEQPTHRYQIITDFAFVRQDRLHNAPVYGKKQRGDVVTGAEETFDGWVHLADEPGWIIKDMQGRQNVGKVLMPLGGEPTLAVPTPLASPGPVTFKVVFKPQIAIRGGPNKQAQIMGMKKAGESIVAEVQTYGGWVRLQGGNTWALTNDATFGKLLESEQVQTAQAQSQAADQNSSLAALDQAVKSRDASQIQQALARARAAGADKARTQAAEQTLAELKADVARLDGKKRDLRQRIDKAKDNERELRDCIDDGARDGFKEETMLAQRMLNELQEARSKTQQKHHGLLERLAAAAASGDKQEMKAARDAAQKGGVDKKEIARIFSLNIINAAEKPTQVPTDAQLPPVDRGPSAAAPAQPTPEAPRTEPGALEIALGVRVHAAPLPPFPRGMRSRTQCSGHGQSVSSCSAMLQVQTARARAAPAPAPPQPRSAAAKHAQAVPRPEQVASDRRAYAWYAGALATELGVLGCAGAWAWRRRRAEGGGPDDQRPPSDPGHEASGDQPLFGGAKASSAPDQCGASPGDHGPEAAAAREVGKDRSALLDNARAIALFFVVVQHCFGEIYFQVSGDLKTWLWGGVPAVKAIFWLAASVNMPVICIVSGVCSQGPPTAKRVRNYFQYLVAPSLLWIGFFHTVLMSMLENQRFPETDLLALVNGEWYLSALIVWRGGSFLFFHRLHPLVLLILAQIASCAGGYITFGPGWYWEFLKGTSMIGFLPYYVLGYVLPLDEILQAVPEPSRLARLGCLVCVVLWAELWPHMLFYEFYGPDAHKSFWEQHTTEGLVFHWDLRLYWTRRLMRWGLEVCQALALLLLVLPRSETCYTWMGPHTLSVYLFHKVFLTWRTKLLVYFPPPVVQSTAGHVVVLAFILLLCGAAMLVCSSLSWRQQFEWILRPKWLDPVAKSLGA